MELSGGSILLTGASRGIGRSTALLLARCGARLTLFSRQREPLEALRASIETAGGTAIAVAGDVRSAADAERAVAAAVERFGVLDAVVNNAGVGALALLAEAPDSTLEDVFATNVLGAYRVTKAALPALRGRGRGVIVNVASFAGKVGVPYYSFYNASKFALVGMSEAWRRELGPEGIEVVLVLPAAVEGEFLTALGREHALGAGPAGTVLRPEQVAQGIRSGLMRPRPEIFIPRRERWLGVLNVLWPRLSDRIVNRLFRYPGARG